MIVLSGRLSENVQVGFQIQRKGVEPSDPAKELNLLRVSVLVNLKRPSRSLAQI